MSESKNTGGRKRTGQLVEVTPTLRRTEDGSYEATWDGAAWHLRRTPKAAGVPEGDDLGAFKTLAATERAIEVAQRIYLGGAS